MSFSSLWPRLLTLISLALALVLFRPAINGEWLESDAWLAEGTAPVAPPRLWFDTLGDEAPAMVLPGVPAQSAALRLMHERLPQDIGLRHLLSVALHLAGLLLVLTWLLRRAGGRLKPGAIAAAAVGGLVFAVHPAQADAVAWLARAPELWATVLALGGAVAVLMSSSMGATAAALGLNALAVAASPAGAALALAGLADRSSPVKRRLVLAGGAVAALVARPFVLGEALPGPGEALSRVTDAALAIFSVSPAAPGPVTGASVALGALALVMAALAAWRRGQVGSLVVVVPALLVGHTSAGGGLVPLSVFGLSMLAADAVRAFRTRPAWSRATAAVAGVVLALGLGWLSSQRVLEFETNDTLYRAEATRRPGDSRFIDRLVQRAMTDGDWDEADAWLSQRAGGGRFDSLRAMVRLELLRPLDEIRGWDVGPDSIVRLQWLVAKGAWDEAAEHAEALLQASPTQLPAWGLLVAAHVGRGEMDAALEAMSRAQELFPSSPALQQAGRHLRDATPYDGAPMTLTGRVRLLVGLRQRAAASAVARLALEENPDDVKALTELMLVQVDGERVADAKATLAALRRVAPDQIDRWDDVERSVEQLAEVP